MSGKHESDPDRQYDRFVHCRAIDPWLGSMRGSLELDQIIREIDQSEWSIIPPNYIYFWEGNIMKCPKCGKTMKAGAKVCQSCGWKAGAKAKPAPKGKAKGGYKYGGTTGSDSD